MVIRMSQNTQMLSAALATVRREITAISDLIVARHSSEHWNLAHSESSERQVRNPSARVARSVCRVLVALTPVIAVVSCNVYDSSLLDTSSNGTGADGGGLVLAGSGPQASSGAGSTLGGSGGNADDSGGSTAAGADNAGDSSTGGTAGTPAGGASGGTSAVAGGGAGGSPTGGGGTGGAEKPTYSLIDDFENPNADIPATDGRQGFWSLANDGTKTGVQTPSPVMVMSTITGGRGTSLYGLHTTAMGFTTSGAQVGVDLNRKTGSRLTYDASAYIAVHFWIKVTATPPVIVHLAMIDKHTDPDGAWCCISTTPVNCTGGGMVSNGLCYGHFGTDITPAPTTTWEERTVSFAALGQPSWADNKVTAVDAAHIYGLQFSWPSAAMDLWIDDISFVKK